MQTTKNAAASVKETAANVAATAKSGMEKTKATVQEKGERLTSHDPMQKEMAMEKKEERLARAEYEKQAAHEQNAVHRQAAETPATGTHSYSTTGGTGQPTGRHQMSALPGHGTGEPTGNVVEGVVGSHPIARDTGTGHTVAGHNTKIGDAMNTGYGTGGASR